MTTAQAPRKPITWGDIYHRWLRKGVDHGWAAMKADEWEKRKQKKEKKHE